MRVLVAYAWERDSTAGIATAIAATLRDAGLDVDCREGCRVVDLDSYDAVVFDSAVHMGRWPTERPLWMFSSGRGGEPNDPAEPSWLEPPDAATVEKLGVRSWGEVHAWATGIASQLRSAAVAA